MAGSHYAPAATRAEFADALVTEIERILERIGQVRVNLHKQRDAKEGREIDAYTGDPISRLLDKATDPIREARKIAAIEAYDRRREAAGS